RSGGCASRSPAQVGRGLTELRLKNPRLRLRTPATGSSERPTTMGRLGLHLITGPANAGEVALLLRRYLEALPQEPYLIVPNRSDVERVERDLLAIQPALFSGSIGTFDDLFVRIARGSADSRPVATEAQRALLVRRALSTPSLNGLGRSARFGGFA